MKRILITGATEFIASAFAKRHQHKFSSITGLSRSAAPFGNGLTSTACDLANYQQLENVSKGMGCIVHTAYDQGDLKKNIIGLQNIIKACQQNNVKRLIYLSTFAVYDPQLKGIVNEE